jgi:hypothetical protein
VLFYIIDIVCLGACLMIVCSYLHISHRSPDPFSDLLQIYGVNLCNLGSGNRIVVQASQDDTTDSSQESIDPHANPHGLSVVRVQLVMLPCSNHGCNMVEDGDGDKGFRVGPVDAATGVGTGEDEQGCSEGDETPAIGADVVKLKVYVISVLISLAAAEIAWLLTGRLQVRFYWGTEP